MKFKKSIIALAMMSVFGAAEATNLILDGDYVKIGVNEATGTLGSGGNTPPGILYDSTGTGTFNDSYDYLTPGSPFEGWALNYNSSTTVYNNNAGITGLAGGVLTDYSGVAHNGSTYDNRAVWTNNTHTDFDILHDYRFNNNQQFVDISTEVTAKNNMTDLYFARFTDPDARAAAGDSSRTDNVVGYGAIPGTNVVFSEALTSRYALGLYSAASTGVNTAITGWSANPVDYYTGGTIYGSGVTYGSGDDVIGIGFYLPTLAAGSTATFSYSYIFGPSAFGAASTAIADGAGGGTPGDVPGGGTLTDVGSATDAAAGGGSPTLVSSVVNSEVTSLAVATPSYAYSSTTPIVAAVVGSSIVITRENITDTTVATRTTTLTTPVTVDTYSDSSTTTTRGTTTTSIVDTTAMTSAGQTQSATARVDTFVNAQHLNLFTQEMLQPDPLSRITMSNGKIERRSGTHLEIDKNSWVWMNGKALNGNDSRGSGFEVGYEKIWNDTTLLGAQVNQTNSRMSNIENGSGKFDSTMINLYAVKQLGRWAIKPMVGYESSDYDTNRTISLAALPNFDGITLANKLSTKGKSYWADLQVIAPKVWKVTPYAGLGVKHYKTDGATETGIAGLEWGSASDTITKPYVGARWDSETTERGIFYTVDGRVTKFNIDNARPKEGWTAVESRYGDTLTSLNTMLGYKLNQRSQMWAGYQYQHADQYNANMISIGGKIDF